jgi:hypothetical protein
MRKLTKKQGLREEAKLVMWNYYKENKNRGIDERGERRNSVFDDRRNGGAGVLPVEGRLRSYETWQPSWVRPITRAGS